MFTLSPKVATATKRDAVDTPVLAYDEMALDFDIVTDFLGTTRTLRDLRTKWMPKLKRESTDTYARRLDMAVLYPILRDTINKIVSRPFGRDVQIVGELPERLAGMGSNINGAGMNLTQFARVLFFDAIAYGKGHVLVEFPSKDNGEESESDQAAAGKLPWFTPITATDLIGWTESITASGEVVLDEIRFREQETVAAGTYRQKAREVIRVVRADGTWEKWSRDLKGWAAAGGYALEASGEHTFPGIPLVTLYTNWTANLCARPPLLDLAWLNAAHYRALSRQLWHEEHLKTPVFLRAGWSDDELRGGIDLGASEGIDTGNENGKASWVEASGSSAQIGRDGLRALEERAEVLGLQHMVSRTGDVRATAVAVDEAKSDNNVQAYLRGAELALRQAFELASQFVGVELDEDFGVDIWSEFPIEARAATDIPFLLQMRRERVISHETALREIRRRGLIDAKLDLGAEVDAVGREGPPLSRVGEPEASAFNFNGR